jgi:hypothetical protein
MQCNSCGAELPDDARFCLRCGAAAIPTQGSRPQPGAPLDFVQPALAAGMALGLLSTLPIINLGCCIWVLGGGALSTYLLMQQRGGPISYGDGAFGGVLSGLFGAVVGTLVQIPLRTIAASMFDSRQAMEEFIQRFPDIDESMRELMLQAASPEISLTTLMFTFISSAVMFSLFAMIGGILAVAVMKKNARPRL